MSSVSSSTPFSRATSRSSRPLDAASEIVKDASKSGRTLREVAREHGVDEETLDKALDLRKIAAGSAAQA